MDYRELIEGYGTPDEVLRYYPSHDEVRRISLADYRALPIERRRVIAHQMVWPEWWRVAQFDAPWVRVAPPRVKNALRISDRDDVFIQDDLHAATLSGEVRRVPGIGPRAFAWLCAYFGIERDGKGRRVVLAGHVCPHCGKEW